MDIMLIFDVNPRTQLALDVQKALDNRGIAYSSAIVAGHILYPKLTVGEYDFVGEEILQQLDRIEKLSRLSTDAPPTCELCKQPAAWVRDGQFSGKFYFCTAHAQKEPDFGISDPSKFVWEELATH